MLKEKAYFSSCLEPRVWSRWSTCRERSFFSRTNPFFEVRYRNSTVMDSAKGIPLGIGGIRECSKKQSRLS